MSELQDNLSESAREDVLMLLADDSKASHMLLATILKKFSCSLDSVSDGMEAVEKFKSTSYDLIFMDSHMPQMDGMDAIREIRGIEQAESLPKTPIVMMTADDSQEDVRVAMEAGADDYLVKPITKERVAALISKFFEVDDGAAESAAPEGSDAVVEASESTVAADSNGSVVYVDEELKELIPGYLERKKQDIQAIADALEIADFDALRVKGHTLKGSGGGYGFDKLTEIGAAIEEAAKIADSAAIRAQLDSMTVYLRNVKVEYK